MTKRKKRPAPRRPSRTMTQAVAAFVKLSDAFTKLSDLPALTASIEADKSRLAFMSARHPLLEEEATNLRAVIREHEGTIARLSKELDDWRKRRG